MVSDYSAISFTSCGCGGVPSGCVSIPCRHIHSVSEMVDLRDVEGAVRLLTGFLETDLRREGF